MLSAGTFLVLGFVSSVTSASSFASSYYNISMSTSPAYPDCRGTPSYIGDGYCDADNNHVECGYDGGDCCACSCASTSSFACGSNGFNCLEPEVGKAIFNCEVVSIEPPDVSACIPGMPRRWVVETTADAILLAEGALCSGGIFEVEWRGYVAVGKTIYAINGTVLDVTGVSDAVADGGGTTQLFSIFNGSLNVRDLLLNDGAGVHGGAIVAAERSAVALAGVAFTYNVATYFGGAVYVENSFLELESNSIFTGNSATHGGAVYISNNSSLLQRVGGGETCLFMDNSAINGGALYVHGGSSVGNNMSFFTSSSSSIYSGGIDYSTESAFSSVNGSTSAFFTYDSYSTADITPLDRTFAKTTFVNNTAQSSGGAVYVDEASRVSYAGETIFEINSGEYGGALFVCYEASVDLDGTTLFTKNRARSDGGAIASAVADSSSLYSHIFVYGTTSFMNNTCGGSGGAIALFGRFGAYWGYSTEFWGNSADLLGGAIYISNVDYGLGFYGVRFTENKAQNGGAVFASGCGTERTRGSTEELATNPSYFFRCRFVGNSATAMGGAIQSTAGRDRIDESIFVKNTASVGGALRLFGTAELVNCSFSDNESGEGGGSAISNDGIISEMVGLNFSANRFQCPPTDYLDFNESNSGFEAACKGCGVLCQGCVTEETTSEPICTPIFAHARSGGGGASTIEWLLVERGFWRATNKSTDVLRCYNADACLGGKTSDPGFCHRGYEGPYCSVCSEGYAVSLVLTCSECSDGNLAVVVVVLAIASLAVFALVRHMVSLEQENITRSIFSRVEAVLPLQSIKIVVVAWQIVTQFGSVANVIYPETYQRLLEVVALVNFDLGWMLTAGCIVDVNFHDGLLAVTSGPIVAVSLLGMTYAVAVRRNRGSVGALRAVRRKHLSAVILLTFFVYSSASSAVFRAFACDKLDDGNVYLRTDYRIECDSPRHNALQIYAGFMIVVYPIGIPIFYIFLLYREHKTLVKGRGREAGLLRQSTSTLRKPYRPSVYYYEVVECSRRIMLTGVVVFIYPNTAAQIAVTIIIAFSFVLVSEWLRPYASRWDFWVSRAGQVVVFLSMYVALLLRVDVSNESQQDRDIFAGILVAVHAIMVLAVIAETVALVYSLRRPKVSLPRTRSSSVRSVYPSDASPSTASSVEEEYNTVPPL